MEETRFTEQTGNAFVIPERAGEAALTTGKTPHMQLNQLSPVALQDELWERMISLPTVIPGRSEISMYDTRALLLSPEEAALGEPEAFPPGLTEFAHIHGPRDGSLHINLPRSEARQVVDKKWGEFHPIVGMGLWPPVMVMVFGPRDEDELATVWRLVQRSYSFALGELRNVP